MEDGESESPDALPTTHVVVDFEEVNGVDATAARSCFLQLAHILREHGIVLLLTAVRPRIQQLLRAHGVIGDADDEAPLCRVLPTLDLGLELCEEAILAECPPTPQKPSELQLDESCGAVASIFAEYMTRGVTRQDLTKLEGYFERIELEPRATIFEAGSPSTGIYVIEQGDVSLFAPTDAASPLAHQSPRSDPSGGERKPESGVRSKLSRLVRVAAPRTASTEGDQAEAEAAALARAGLVDTRRRVQRFRNGGLFGGLDTFLQQRRTFTAESSTACVLHRLSKERMGRMLQEQPKLAALVNLVCLKSLCLDVQSVSYLL